MEEKKLREIIKRVLNERFQDDDLGAFSGDFDEFDFDDAAMQAAKRDIEASGEEFEELGKSKFEKNNDFKKKFKSDLKRANLNLPSDEEEVERLAQVVKDRGEHEKKFGAGTLNEQDFDTDVEGTQPGDDERTLNEDDTLDTTSLYNFLKDALYKYDSLNLDYAEAAKELETALTSKFDVISRDKMSFSLNENIDRPTDSEGNQIKLKSLVRHKKDGFTGRVERFIVGDDNEMKVKVMWMEDIHQDALPPEIVSTQDIIVTDQTSSLNELYNFNDNDFLEVLIGDAGLDYMKSESPDILEFDVIEAIYIFRHDHNEDHPFLHYLNKIVSDSGFKPNQKLSSYGDLDDAGKILYDELVNNEEFYKEKYLDGAFGYEFLEESGVRSHASGRGQNSKPSSFPDNLKRYAIREGK